ncbi:MAG: radical SAM family heme chaperone HemW [Pseudomonadota bacterium]
MNDIPLSLYIHLPWCVKKCPYCDFNSHEIKTNIPEETYIKALIKDLQQQQNLVGNREIISIFIGGGTPSTFSSQSIQHLLNSTQDLLNISKLAEITIEANPGTLDQENFAGFHDAGINRISIGVQSFANLQLQQLGRIHDAQAAIESVRVAKQVGFENINIDLMYALPGQNEHTALNDVEQAIELQPTHISYYQLTLEPNTAFYRQPPSLPDSQTSWDIQQTGVKLLADHGYNQYEVSAYAQNKSQCAHNKNYWQFGDYIGIGAGAHQKLTLSSKNSIQRCEKPKHPQQYMNTMLKTDYSIPSHTLLYEDIVFEFMLNALRLKQGFSKQQFEAHTGLKMATIAENIETQVRAGLLVKEADNIRCSDQGYRFLDDLQQTWLPQAQILDNIN